MRLENVCFRYGRGDWTLHGVNVSLEPGETAVVLGRNGVGKSTLLQLCAGVLRPVRGRITGRPQTVGWAPERFPADQPFTAEQYLTWMAAVRGADPGAVPRWLDRLGLLPVRTVRLGELSKGTAQKVGLAQALLSPPELLVLDEPWEGLDAQTRTLVPDIVAEVVAAGGRVLISDHLGELAVLPGAARWTVADGGVTTGSGEPADAEVVVEIGVPRAAAAAAVARLRADGHRVLGVRPPAVDA